jgi:hypothetical protein
MRKLIYISLLLSSSFVMAAPVKKKPTTSTDDQPTNSAATTDEKPKTHEHKHKKKTYAAHYGMAGCGFASTIISDKSQWSEVGKSLINMSTSSGTNTFAMTSGTSNCVESRADMQAMEQRVFMKVNFVNLSKEASQGDGENLRALSEVFGCSDSDGFTDFSRSHFESIFNQEDSETVLKNFQNAIKADAVLSHQCQRIS